MKAVILAAGYGTRLQQDIIQDNNNKLLYSHLLNLPKPLLPLGGSPNHQNHQNHHHTLVDYWLKSLNDHFFISNSNEKKKKKKENYENIYIVTNDHFYSMFIDWANRVQFPVDHVLNDGTVSNERRMGAIADIQFAIDYIFNQQNSKKLDSELDNDDDDGSLMIIGGDTLFSVEFHTRQMQQIALDEGFRLTSSADVTSKTSEQQPQQQHPIILYYTLDPSVNASEKGILEVEKLSNNKARVIKFLEKPQPHETNSRLASPCFYMLDSASVPLVKQFLDSVRNDSKLRDAPGHFVRYLVENRGVVMAYEIEKRFDVGHLDEYITTNEYWIQHEQLL